MTLSSADWQSLFLTYQLALVTSALLIPIATPIAWWLARSRSVWRSPFEALFAMPLVLPPTVLGFYLLLAFTPGGFLGATWFTITGQSLAFSFEGLVIGSIIYSFPFVLQPLQTAFERVDPFIVESAEIIGAKRSQIFLYQIIPLCKRAFLAAFVLGFAHTLGEFGLILMIGGNIPGETQVASITLYEHVEALQYPQAHALSFALVLSSFSLLLALFFVNRYSANKHRTAQ